MKHLTYLLYPCSLFFFTGDRKVDEFRSRLLLLLYLVRF